MCRTRVKIDEGRTVLLSGTVSYKLGGVSIDPFSSSCGNLYSLLVVVDGYLGNETRIRGRSRRDLNRGRRWDLGNSRRDI